MNFESITLYSTHNPSPLLNNGEDKKIIKELTVENTLTKYIEEKAEKPQELNPQPGENIYAWMSRNVQWWLLEVEKIATDPKTPIKTKLDAFKELLNKTLPSISALEFSQMQRSPIDNMSEAELIARIKEKIKQYEEENPHLIKNEKSSK